MAIIDDVVAAVQPDLDTIHSSIQEALQGALATSFSSPVQEASSRAMISALDASIRNILVSPVEVFIQRVPFFYGFTRTAVRPVDLTEDDAAGSLEVVVEGTRVFIRSSRTQILMID